MHKCRICGAQENAKNWMPGKGLQLERNQLCFSCQVWTDLIEHDKTIKEPDTFAIVDGVHYLHYDKYDGGFRGHGGALFIIRFHDGRVIRSTNLWCQGDIPQHFRDVLKDNAVFS